MAPKQGKMARQEAGASGKPAKVRKISDQKAAMMLVSCKEERYAQHHLEEKQLVSSRVGEDASLASAFAAWIMKNDKKKMLEDNVTRNARDTKSTGFRVVRQIIMFCFEFGAEGIKTLNNVKFDGALQIGDELAGRHRDSRARRIHQSVCVLRLRAHHVSGKLW